MKRFTSLNEKKKIIFYNKFSFSFIYANSEQISEIIYGLNNISLIVLYVCMYIFMFHV